MTLPDTPPPSVRRRRFEERQAQLREKGLLMPGEEPAAITERVGHWHSSVKPWDPFEDWLLGRLATESIRLEQLELQEQTQAGDFALRAELMWDEDRTLAAEELGATLSKHPARVSRRLRATFHGCAWLIGRWVALRGSLDHAGAWDEARRARALDLLGVAPEAREGDPFGLAAAPVEVLREFADAQIARLTDLKDGPLAELDARERANAAGGVFADVPKPLAYLKRQIADAKRRFAWAQQQFRKARPGKFAGPSGPGTSPPGAPRPAAPPRPAPPPPPMPGERSEEEIRRREALLATLARRVSEAPLSAPLPPPAPVTPGSLVLDAILATSKSRKSRNRRQRRALDRRGKS